MANHHHHHHQSQSSDQVQQLPQVLVLRPPICFTFLESHYSHRLNFLKAWESHLSLDQFLANHGGFVRALISSANGPPITSDILRLLPFLGFITTTSTGVDHVDLAECRKRGVAVSSAGNLFSLDVADMAVGLLIDVLRKISASDRFVRCGLWASSGDYHLGSKLGSKRVGIVGLGNIGLEVAKRLEGFGCKVLYNSRKAKPFVSYPFYSNVTELAAESDVLIICCALTEKTRLMINKEVMLALGKDGVIVNVGRGQIINEKEMVECLKKGELGGAALDVFENEPLVPAEFFEMDNVVLSPHASVLTPESMMALCELIVSNLESFFSNKPLISQVLND